MFESFKFQKFCFNFLVKKKKMTALKSPLIKLNTEYEIPLVGFGTYKINGQDKMDLVIDCALQAGYRHFDTALLYANEEELGNSLQVCFV